LAADDLAGAANVSSAAQRLQRPAARETVHSRALYEIVFGDENPSWVPCFDHALVDDFGAPARDGYLV
jgi:hypothetical protein